MKITINNEEIEISGRYLEKRIIDFLRDDFNLTGAKNACDVGVCGACAILVNEKQIKVCNKSVKDFEGCRILTIEGLQNEDGTLHPLQQAFIDAGAIQCGYCTPGMVLTAHSLLLKNPNPDREEIRKAIYPNLCRCTGYEQIINAIETASQYYRQKNEKDINKNINQKKLDISSISGKF